MKLLSLFSGIGAFEKALKNQNIDFELVGYSEIDKPTAKAYSLIHDVSEDLNLGDIRKIQNPPKADLITYGFPCQDISVLGKQAGFKDSNGNPTRSGLFYEALRIIKEVQPKIAIAENVKALLHNKHKDDFNCVLKSLDDAGYVSFYRVLNAKDFNVPQNRESVYCQH